MGQVVLQADEGIKQAGHYTYRIDATQIGGTNFNAGVYFYSIEINGQRVATRKMIRK